MTPLSAGLLAVLLIGKLLTLLGSPVEVTPLLLPAWVWQDLLLVALFAIVDRVVAIRWIPRVLYVVLVVIGAVNVPVTLVLSSSLSVGLLRAARGTLADSIAYHTTAANLAIFLGLLATAAIVPWLFIRLQKWRRRPSDARRLSTVVQGAGRRLAGQSSRMADAVLLCVLGSFLIVGPWAGKKSQTLGLEQNALFSIVGTSLPRIRGSEARHDWRMSALPDTLSEGEDYSALAGAFTGANLLLVVLESTAASYLSPFGAPQDPAPNVTRLAERSLIFASGYAVYPESVRGLVSYLSSRFPAFDVRNEEHVGVAQPSIATVLSGAGYTTAIFHSGRFQYLGMREVVDALGFHSAEDAGHIGGNVNSSFGVDEKATVQRVLRWIDDLPPDARFFATYLPIAAHHPYVYEEAGPFPNDEEINRYRNAIFDGDRAIGTLLDGLSSRGLDSNTVIVVIADHGEAFGQHAGNYAHVLALFEENVRVPVIIALPAGHTVTGREKRVVSLVDLPPTLLQLLGVGAPADFQGTSMLSPSRLIAPFFTDYGEGLLGARDGCFKVIYQLRRAMSSLFNLCSDSLEQRDIAGSYPEMVELYETRLRLWSGEQVGRVRR